MNRKSYWFVAAVASVGGLVMLNWSSRAEELAGAKPTDKAIERARREVRMLDDLYKTAVVLINDHYVQDETSLAAGVAARALFAAMQEKGWHEAHLVDATGEAVNSDNNPRNDFEKAAIK